MAKQETTASASNDKLRQEYRQELAGQTLKIGRLAAFIGIPALIAFAAKDLYILATHQFLIWRIVGIVPLVVYLVLSYTVLKQRPRLIVPLHAVSLGAIMIMALGINFVVLLSDSFPGSYRVGISSGLLLAVVLVFVFSAGARKYLLPILIVPFVTLIIALLFVETVTLFDLSFYSNPLLAAIGVALLSRVTEGMSFGEFKLRRAAETSKNSLEVRVGEIGDLNVELKQALDDLQHEVSERQSMEGSLQTLVLIDDLTGVYNRRASLLFLERMHNTANRRNEPFTLCFVDVDNLKVVNDNLGHAEGDVVLRNVAKALKQATRGSDEVFRIGGDEFVLVLPDCTREGAEEILRRVKDRIRDVTEEEQAACDVDISYGFAEYTPGSESDVDSLLKIADSNMYKNKIRKKEGKKPE